MDGSKAMVESVMESMMKRIKNNRAIIAVLMCTLVYFLSFYATDFRTSELQHPQFHLDLRGRHTIHFNHGADRGKVPLATSSSFETPRIKTRKLQNARISAIDPAE